MKSIRIEYCSLLWVAIGILGRIIPHYPNATPLISLCLFSGLLLTCSQALILMLITLGISDLVLSYLNHYPFLGSWSFFTYSAFIAMTYWGCNFLQNLNYSKTIQISVIFTLFFWLWTNFGVWLATSYYPHTLSGLAICYESALPFLRNSVIGSLAWTSILYLGLFYFKKESKHYSIIN